MINNVTIAGRLANDMELRHTQSGTAVGNFTLAVSRPKQKDKEQVTDWIDCVMWGKGAEGLAQYLTKGKPIAVIGELQTRSWKDKEDKNRKTVEVKVDRVNFLPDSKGGQAPAKDMEMKDVEFDPDSLPF